MCRTRTVARSPRHFFWLAKGEDRSIWFIYSRVPRSSESRKMKKSFCGKERNERKKGKKGIWKVKKVRLVNQINRLKCLRFSKDFVWVGWGRWYTAENLGGSVERWWISINHWKSESVGKWFVTAKPKIKVVCVPTCTQEAEKRERRQRSNMCEQNRLFLRSTYFLIECDCSSAVFREQNLVPDRNSSCDVRAVFLTETWPDCEHRGLVRCLGGSLWKDNAASSFLKKSVDRTGFE